MVIVYTQPTCGRCNVLKRKLSDANIEFSVCEDIDLMVSKGFRTTPMLEVDDKVMDFSSAIEWIESEAKNNG